MSFMTAGGSERSAIVTITNSESAASMPLRTAFRTPRPYRFFKRTTFRSSAGSARSSAGSVESPSKSYTIRIRYSIRTPSRIASRALQMFAPSLYTGMTIVSFRSASTDQIPPTLICSAIHGISSSRIRSSGVSAWNPSSLSAFSTEGTRFCTS